MSKASDYLEGELRRGIFRTNTYAVRANSTAYSVGDRVYLATFDGNFYEAIVAGTSAASPPAFNTNLGDSTTDGTVTWRTVKPGYPKKALWVALYTATPSDSGGGTEVSGGSYARVRLDPADANWTGASATDGLTDNAVAITFPAPTANWGVITSFGIHDHPTAGNLLVWGALTTNKTVNSGDPAPSYAVGALDITFA